MIPLGIGEVRLRSRLRACDASDQQQKEDAENACRNRGGPFRAGREMLVSENDFCHLLLPSRTGALHGVGVPQNGGASLQQRSPQLPRRGPDVADIDKGRSSHWLSPVVVSGGQTPSGAAFRTWQ